MSAIYLIQLCLILGKKRRIIEKASIQKKGKPLTPKLPASDTPAPQMWHQEKAQDVPLYGYISYILVDVEVSDSYPSQRTRMNWS